MDNSNLKAKNYLKEIKNAFNKNIKNKKEEINNNFNKINKKDLKIKDLNDKIEYYSNPLEIEYLFDLIKDSKSDSDIYNTFCVFNSINNIFYLIYICERKSIISYDLINIKKINEIKNAHNKNIREIRHYLDNIKKRNLILSISSDDNNLKLWNIINFECLLNIKNVNKKGSLYSACILNNNNNYYIITSNWNKNNSINNIELIKIFNFKGIKIKEINDSNNNTYFISNYYDKKLSKNYIITGNSGFVKSYDFNDCKIYQTYKNLNNYYSHTCIIINKKEALTELIESTGDGYIQIWNFHSAQLLKSIKVSSLGIYNICFWNNKYLFVGSNNLMLMDLTTYKIIKNYKEYDNNVVNVEKMIHPKYGESLISLNEYGIIQLWINKNIDKIKTYY